MSKWVVILSVVLAAGALGFLGWTIHRGRGADVTIATTPERAGAWLDGRWLGSTPVRTRDVAPGSHVLRLTRFGRETLVKQVSLGQGANDLRFSLGAVARGAITVSSVPPGAEVSLDGQPRGVTPVELRGVSAGTHAVRLSLVDYTDWTGTTDVADDRPATLNVSMTSRFEAYQLEMMKLNPHDTKACAMLARYYVQRGEWKKAQDILTKGLEMSLTGDGGGIFGEVQKIFHPARSGGGGDGFFYDDVPRGQQVIIDSLMTVIRAHPDKSPTLYASAVTFATERGMNDLVQEIIENGIGSFLRDNAWAVNALGFGQLQDANLDGPLNQYNRKVQDSPDDFTARFRRMTLLRMKGGSDDVVAGDCEALAKQARSIKARAKLWSEAARIRARRHEADQAEEAYKQAVALQDDVEAACRLRLDWARFNIDSGKPERAKPVLDDVLKFTKDEGTRNRAKDLLGKLKPAG